MRRYGFMFLVVFVALLVSLASVAGAKYNEAPMLSKRVAAGDLPPVDERLPKEPLVVKPLEQVGKYGGTINRGLTGVADEQGWTTFSRASLVEWALGETKAIPSLAKSWETSPDGKVYTFHLREGARWSDGHPFTADDLVFYYEAIASNKELSPAFPTWLRAGGEPVKIVKVDDYTVEFRFKAPYGLFVQILAFNGRDILKPKHYLERFHPDYTDKNALNTLVKREGFDQWYQLFDAKDDVYLNPDRPTMRAWKVEQAFPASQMIAVRNPYYWKVDTEGNQLPYVDRVVSHLAENSEVITLRAASGGIDYQYRHMQFSNFPILIDGEKNGYKVYRWNAERTTVVLHTNQSHSDPVIRQLMQNKDFRAALSHAIDRQTINDLVFSGLGVITHPVAQPGDIFWVDGFGQRWIDYDINKANALLDKAGLDKRDAAGFRLRPDGKRLELQVLTRSSEMGGPVLDAYELVTEFWRKVGIKVELTIVERALWSERMHAGEFDIGAYGTAGMLWFATPEWYVPIQSNTYWAPLYGAWYSTNGSSGVEPPAIYKKMQSLWDELKITVDPEKQIKLGQDLLRIHDENVFMIGVVSQPFQPVVVNSDLFNVLETGTSSYRLLHEAQTWPEQVSYKNPAKH